MRKQEQKGKITALYERLSHDDGRSDESVSVENQKRILEDYARKNGFTNVRHFTDDGVRGTTFKRPGLDAMVDDIRAGNVATVIVKDQSRIGRDVVEVGLLKRTFDEYNVRFIAANDNLDTANGFDIMSIFRDVINEWYVADTSRKIKTVFKSRMEKGLRCSGAVPYGYLASKEEKGEWVIDEEAAAVVRRIFQMVMDGQSVNGIARTLRAEQIPIPSEHWKRIGCPVRANSYRDPYAWSATTLGYILKRPEYLGRKVLGKTVCENYKTKSTRRTMPEEQFVFEGAVPAIIDEETWHNVQRLRETKRRTPKRSNAPNRLTGLLYCADCGAKLTHHNSLVQGKYIDDAFTCSRYRAPMEDCTIHYVATQKLEAAILSAIQRISWYVRNNEQEFVQRVRKASSLRQEEAVKDCRKQIVQAKKRHAELDGLVKKLYEANATGKLPDKHFSRLLAEYDEEQAALEASMTEWQGLLDNWNADDQMIVISGTTAETYLTKEYPDIPLQKYDSYATAKNALENGNGVAWANDNTEVIAFAKQNSGYTVGIPSLGSQDTIAPAVSKGNTTLLDWINDEIKSLGEESFFHKDYEETLVDTYGLDYEDELVVEGGETNA